MGAYYNEIDPKKAAWLRDLIKKGVIADGEVDERDIQDVLPGDLDGYRQHHFFAGIGIWSLALREAGWPDERPVWTGSCPCQPFSSAGKRKGASDERHLWPSFFHLIQEFWPRVVIGEQVASRDGLAWFDLVSDDMEGQGYTIGAVDSCAAGFGAPHIRQRLYFTALRIPHSNSEGPQRRLLGGDGRDQRSPWAAGMACWLPNPKGERRERGQDHENQRRRELTPTNNGQTRGPTNGYWREAEWIPYGDGAIRPIEPGSFPLVDGAAARVLRICGYGDGIVLPQARGFIKALMDVID